jgi:hypothetical protein
MRTAATLATAAVLAFTMVASAQTVTLTLQSPQAGQTVGVGDPINWELYVEVSTGDNQGLALVAVDLVQDAGNPELFDIPPADATSDDSAPMNQFSRPLGISNPGEGGADSGYIGVQRGTPANLIQIGGGQNTFGQAGATIGTDPNVVAGVGQSGQQLVATGSFNAPATEGTYTLQLANGIANVLTSIGGAGQFSPVAPATVDLSNGSLSFEVGLGPVICPADCNCDGLINFQDIPFLKAALGNNEQAWADLYDDLIGGTPPCDFQNCNANEDPQGLVNFQDIPALKALLGTSCP